MTILSKIQQREVKAGDNNDDDDTVPRGFISNILKIANDDILLEIFIRIPDCRSAILCSSVSQRWHSLISNPRFIPRFVSQHHQNQAHYPLPYTIIFRKCEMLSFRSALNFQPICKLFSENSMFLHGKSRNSSYLDFLPSPMVIRASCNDLLLLTPGSASSSVFYVCNPVTKQFYELPQNHWLSGRRKIRVDRYALVRNPEYECHFKVLLFHTPHHPFLDESPNTIQDVTIYCSKLGKWELKSFEYPQPLKLGFNLFSTDIFMLNGILYYMEYVGRADRVLALDLSKFQCIIVNFPDDFGWVGSRQYHGLRVKRRIGIVDGEVRLVQVVLRKSRRRVCLKVWRLLDYSSSLWVLLHEKKYPRAPNEERYIGVFVHPVDGDKVFMVWGKHVFQYDLTKKKKKTYKMMGELQEPLKTGDYFNAERLAAIPMVHPAWPTPLPPRRFSV
ncbi:U3 snoRNP protein [Castilleja foliolosa]|uniref:U3 snoRNP protein n=1 Tax=Castilleja foliolosa TaxID=1961234 RepID=A0ABD3EEM2_9LAMI